MTKRVKKKTQLKSKPALLAHFLAQVSRFSQHP